jgi:hypothetical protein
MIGDEASTTIERIDGVIRTLPIVGSWVRDGPRDPVYDLLMVAGPVVLLLVRLLGRGPLTEGLVLLYLLSFVGYLGSKYVGSER